MKMSEYFIISKRIDGQSYVHLNDDAPPCLQGLVRDIHTNCFYDSLPDDWIYEQISNAFERIEECSCDSDFYRAKCKIEPNLYTNQLLEWAKAGYAQAWIQDMIDDKLEVSSLSRLLEVAQVCAIRAIYHVVWDFFDERRV